MKKKEKNLNIYTTSDIIILCNLMLKIYYIGGFLNEQQSIIKEDEERYEVEKFFEINI